MEDKIIELADYFIGESKTYREAKIACEKLLKQVSFLKQVSIFGIFDQIVTKI